MQCSANKILHRDERYCTVIIGMREILHSDYTRCTHSHLYWLVWAVGDWACSVRAVAVDWGCCAWVPARDLSWTGPACGAAGSGCCGARWAAASGWSWWRASVVVVVAGGVADAGCGCCWGWAGRGPGVDGGGRRCRRPGWRFVGRRPAWKVGSLEESTHTKNTQQHLIFHINYFHTLPTVTASTLFVQWGVG